MKNLFFDFEISWSNVAIPPFESFSLWIRLETVASPIRVAAAAAAMIFSAAAAILLV